MVAHPRILRCRQLWSQPVGNPQQLVADRTGQLESFYETDLVPLADQSVQAALLAYRSNRAMVDDVVTARRVALETNLKHLRLSADRAQAQYQVDYLVGEEP